MTQQPHPRSADQDAVGNRTELLFLWFLKNDADIGYNFDQSLLRNSKLGIQNWKELGVADRALQAKTKSLVGDDVPLPDEFPAPRLALPGRGFAPDYFKFGRHTFCSRRFRDALVQPKHVVQFTPVDLVSGGAMAQAQDYRLMRVIPWQPAMDLERSECEVNEFISPINGKHVRHAGFIDRFAWLDGLQPKTDIFRIDESPTYILVKDEVAERVLKAGCTGMEFSHPDNMQTGMRIERYRTADGIAERRVHMY